MKWMIKFIIVLALISNLHAKEKVKIDSNQYVNVQIQDMNIMEYVKIISKILKKNILLKQNVAGKINFVSSKPIKKQDLVKILIDVLNNKGLTIVERGDYWEIVNLTEAIKKNLKIVNLTNLSKNYAMVGTIINIKNVNAYDISSKINYLISKGGKIIPIKDSNALMIIDYPEKIKMIKKAIELLDKPINKSIKIVPLKNVKADDIFPILLNIIKNLSQNKGTGQINVIKDINTNSLIIIGSKDNINKIIPTIEKLDIKNVNKKETVVIPIKNSEAKDVATVLNTIFSKRIYLDRKNKPLITVDKSTNSIIAYALKSDIEDIKNILKSLDKEKTQVYVKARIIEISENKMKNIGIKYGLEGATATDNALFSFALNMGGNSVALSSTLLSQIDIPVTKSGLALGAAIDFLKSQGVATVVSEPSILCINNETSMIYVGQTKSILVSSVAGTDSTSLVRNTYKRQDIGLTLKVKPRISNDNKVNLNVKAILEDVVESSAAQLGLPTTTKREVETTAIVKNGQSVIVGGLIKAKSSNSETKVPLLGDIPVIGNLFRHKTNNKDKVNLVIILTPYIVKKSEDLMKLKENLVKLDLLQKRFAHTLEKELKKRLYKQNSYTNDSNNISPENIINPRED